MTKAQQIILLVIVILLIGVVGLLAFTLINPEDAASTVPTLAVLPTSTVQPPGRTPTAFTVPPTWTLEPTRTSPATNTPRFTGTATPLPSITPTFAPTFTPRATELVTATALPPTTTVGLQNPGFEGVSADSIPGWSWWAADNYTPGGDYSPDTSYDTPLLKEADDPVRIIDGPTLQIDATQHVKFKVFVYQTADVPPSASVGFEASASAFSDSGPVQVSAGIDPAGGVDCSNAVWSDTLFLDQGQPVQSVVAPEVVAGANGRVTVCLFSEPLYAAVSNSAFFDDAAMTVIPPRPTPGP
jgi:hypothetical protein